MNSDPYSELGGRPETYEEALARSLVNQPTAGLTEQERAEKLAEQRERMARHDEHFGSDFVSGADVRLISKSLMKKLGYSVGDSPGARDD